MQPVEIKAAKAVLRGKVASLRNDYKKAFAPPNDESSQPAPFPIAMYVMSALDLLSSCEAGWNFGGGNQTDRMVDYLVDHFHYDRISSVVAVTSFRHQLMHTSEPRLIKDTNTNDMYYWKLADTSNRHMQLDRNQTIQGYSDVVGINFGIEQFTDDFERATEDYLSRMEQDTQLQDNYVAV